MPVSKLVPNLRYGWSAVSTLNPWNGMTIESQLSNNADFRMDERFIERIAVLNSGDVWVTTLLDGYPILRE